MKRLFFGTAAIIALNMAGSALAADMRVKAPVLKAPPPAAAYSWAGCYVGANGGYGWQPSHPNTITIQNGGLGPIVLVPTSDLNPKGGFGGGQIGCNYQSGSIVWGVEGDVEGSGIRDSFGPTLFTVPGILTVTASQKLNWFGTARGRVGFAVDRVLFYATGGAAFGKTEYQNFSVDAANNTATINGDSSRFGYVVGGGVEWAIFGAWSAKAEYQYLNFGNFNAITAGARTPAGVLTGATATTNPFRNDYHTIRLGANFKFN